jgi:hypothetical protein
MIERSLLNVECKCGCGRSLRKEVEDNEGSALAKSGRKYAQGAGTPGTILYGKPGQSFGELPAAIIAPIGSLARII